MMMILIYCLLYTVGILPSVLFDTCSGLSLSLTHTYSPKITEFDSSIFADKYVLGLHVSVKDAVRVKVE